MIDAGPPFVSKTTRGPTPIYKISIPISFLKCERVQEQLKTPAIERKDNS